MAWHEDGTQAFIVSTGVQLTQANLEDLNNESGNVNITSSEVVIIFPEHRDLDAIWLNGSSTQTVSVLISSDSTNGMDGTWVSGPSVPIVPDSGNPLGSGWRSSIASSTAFDIKAVKFTVNNLRNVHLYGEIVPGYNPQRIEFWHPTEDQKQPPNWFDWGNTPRQSTDQVSFRLRNMSPFLMANDVVVSLDALTDTSPSVEDQHFLSLDTIRWSASVDAGDIAADSLSPVVHLRRVTPSNAQLTPPRWAVRLKSIPSFWS